jgi:hypothetical protein
MLTTSAVPTGDESRHDGEERGRATLVPTLQIPKNKSTGNLGAIGDSSEKARLRFSFDAGAAAAEYDTMTRLALRAEERLPWIQNMPGESPGLRSSADFVFCLEAPS